MIKHIVCFKLKDPSPKNCERARDVLLSMDGKVELLRGIEVGIDFLHSERSYDLALITVFESWDAYKAYLTHPAHLPVKAGMHAARSGSVSCDYEIKE